MGPLRNLPHLSLRPKGALLIPRTKNVEGSSEQFVTCIAAVRHGVTIAQSDARWARSLGLRD